MIETVERSLAVLQKVKKMTFIGFFLGSCKKYRMEIGCIVFCVILLTNRQSKNANVKYVLGAGKKALRTEIRNRSNFICISYVCCTTMGHIFRWTRSRCLEWNQIYLEFHIRPDNASDLKITKITYNFKSNHHSGSVSNPELCEALVLHALKFRKEKQHSQREKDGGRCL